MPEIRAQLQAMEPKLLSARADFQAQLQEYFKQFPQETVTTPEVQDKIRAKQEELQNSDAFKGILESVQELTRELGKYMAEPEPSAWVRDKAVPHGYVWLFLRK